MARRSSCKWVRIAALAAAAVLLAGRPAAAQELTLRYGQAYSAARSIYSLPIAVGQSRGFFRQEGLDFQLVVPIPGGSDKMIAALHDDTVDVTHVASPFLVRAALAGSDAVAIAAEFNNPIYSLVAQRQINTFADLKGRRIGLADEGGTITYSIRRLLAQNGVGAGDFQAKIIEGTPARLSCLMRGECAAVPLGQPDDLTAAAAGFRVLGYSTDAVPEFLYTVTAVRRSWVQAHAEAVARYVRALAAAFRFIRNPANRSAVIATIVATTGCSETVAANTLRLYFEPERNVLPQQGELRLGGLRQVIAFMGATGAIPGPLPDAARFVDLRYLRMAGID